MLFSQCRFRQLQPVFDAVPLCIIVSKAIDLRTTGTIDEVFVGERVGLRWLAFDNSGERDHGSSVTPSPRLKCDTRSPCSAVHYLALSTVTSPRAAIGRYCNRIEFFASACPPCA